jgi:hypothetical protein
LKKTLVMIFIWIALFLAGWQISKFIVFWAVGDAPIWQTSTALFVQLVLNVLSASVLLFHAVRGWRGKPVTKTHWLILAIAASGASTLIAAYAEVWAGEIDWLSIAGFMLAITYLISAFRFRAVSGA